MSDQKRGLSPAAVYPVILTDLKDAVVVVVGGGRVGERKIQGLLTVGARVRLISPRATPGLQTLAEAGKIEWLQRPYQTGDLTAATLVFAATDQRRVNAQVAQEAKTLDLLHNVADKPDEGNFHLPAIFRSEDLLVTISTAGRNPSQAGMLRDRIARWLRNQAGFGEAEEI